MGAQVVRIGHCRRTARLAALALAALALLTGCSLPAPAGPANLRYRDPVFTRVTQQDAIPYATAPDATGAVQTWTLDMYTPTGDTQSSRPAIVLVHGGGFRGGTSKDGGMVTLADAFAKTGYVAVSINYPLLAGTHVCAQENPPSQTCIDAAEAAQHAAQAAIRFLRANAAQYAIDPSRIAVEGASAGAVTALAVAVNASDPGTDGNLGYPSNADAAMAISGELPHSYSNIYDSGDAPVLMFNGTADRTVPFAEGLQTAVDLFDASVPVIFESLDGAGHVPFATDGATLVSQSIYFAYDFMDLAQAAGQPPAAERAFRAQVRRLRARNPRLARTLMRGR